MDKVIKDGYSSAEEASKKLPNFIGISERFALLNKLITRDLNHNTSSPTFKRYSKDEIQSYLSDPYKNEKKLREAITYIYGASSHFRRLVQYFVSLSDLVYIVEPYRIDPKKSSARMINTNYRRVLNMLSSINIKTQFKDVLTVCIRDDVYYGTLWVTNDNITLQQLPSDYCAISTIEGNVPNVTFNFQYFDTHKEMLEFYPEEFRKKYKVYQNKRTEKWLELESPTSFAIKCSSDITAYPLPMFAGLLRELYDIEDYKQLRLTKTALENYAMLCMKLPMSNDGSWGIDFDKAKEFWKNLDSVLPDEIGSVLSPMPIDKISFEKSSPHDVEAVSDAEQNLFTTAGVSSLLFNNDKASANALALSIKADQAITYGIVCHIEDALNRFIQSQPYGKNFKVTFLDVSSYNRKEASDAFLKAASYGLPTISAYAAAQGINQAELDSMSYLEGTVLGLQELFKPIRSSTQMTADEINGSEPGAPAKDPSELTDSGEQSAEDKDDWG